MKNTSIVLLVLFVAVSSAARFPFTLRGNPVCNDCSGLTAALCYCSDLDNCDAESCSNTGGCTRAICDATPARKRMMKAFLKREPKPNACADCEGFAADCDCAYADICRGMGCGVGECEANCPAKRMMSGYLQKRTCEDPDCPGLGAGCSCDDIEYCESQGCNAGDCNGNNCAKRKRAMYGYLHKRTCEDPDCPGLGAGCPCDDIDYCESQGCDAGDCDRSNCGARKRMMKTFLKREPKPNDCPDCAGFASGCPCGNLDICDAENCPSAGGCDRSNCESARKRMMKAFLKREPKPNDCPDCAGFASGCPCSNLDICDAENCPSAGSCNRGNCEE